MTDRTLIEAQRRLTAAEAEVKRWRAFMAQAAELVAETDGQHEDTPSRRVPPPPPALGARETNTDETARNSLARTEAAAVKIIREAGGPLSTALMFDALRLEGVEFSGQDPRNVMSSRLSRAKGLEFKAGLGWGLREAEPPESDEVDPLS